MKKLILLNILLLFYVLGGAQEQYSKLFGKVTQHEMSMTEYDKDKDAEAVVIYELGDNRFIGDHDYGFRLHMTKSIKIKILKSSGTKFADFEIPYYVDNETEAIEDIEAYTYNWVEGKLETTKLDKKNIFEAKPHGKWRTKTFTMPDVREGSVVELKYKIVTPYYFNMRTWEFQKEIPVIYSLLQYRAIPYYEYSYILTGTDKFDEFESSVNNTEIRFGSLVYKEMNYTFGKRDIPAFRDEEFISSARNFKISLDFQISKLYFASGGSKSIISTWPDMCTDLMKEDRFGKYIKNSEKAAKNVLPALSLAEKGGQLEQAKAIVNHVKSMYNWNGINDKYAVQKVSDLIKLKTGNTADINLFMIGLLQAANITVNPVVLSTRAHGAIRKSYPFIHFLNYVIAEIIIDGQKYYVDATASMLPFDEVPTRCVNVEALVVKPKIEEWTVITQKKTKSTDMTFYLKIDEAQGKIDATITYETLGADAHKYRSIYLGKEEGAGDGKDEYLLAYLQESNNIKPKDGLKVSNFKDFEKPFVFSFDVELGLEKVGEKLFINPFCNLSPSNNLFKQSTRDISIDLTYISHDSFKSVIEIPEGYKIEHMPRTIKHDGKVMKINYKVIQEGTKIEVFADYSNKSNLYPASDYVPLKASFSEMIKSFSNMIVLVKE